MAHSLLHVGLGGYGAHPYYQGVFDIAPNGELKGNSHAFDASIDLPLVHVLSHIYPYNWNCIINKYAHVTYVATI